MKHFEDMDQARMYRRQVAICIHESVPTAKAYLNVICADGWSRIESTCGWRPDLTKT